MLIENYDPEWPKWFYKFKMVFYSKLNNLIIDIHHIGSTAVPNLPAKAIIDIDIVIKDYGIFNNIIDKLGELGYAHAGDQGIKHREAFKPKDETVPYNDLTKKWIKHHLYVCPEFSEELKRQIAFRDYLRSHEDARNEYAKIKRYIAAKAHDDKILYAKIKEIEAKEFIENTIKKVAQPL